MTWFLPLDPRCSLCSSNWITSSGLSISVSLSSAQSFHPWVLSQGWTLISTKQLISCECFPHKLHHRLSLDPVGLTNSGLFILPSWHCPYIWLWACLNFFFFLLLKVLDTCWKQSEALRLITEVLLMGKTASNEQSSGMPKPSLPKIKMSLYI